MISTVRWYIVDMGILSILNIIQSYIDQLTETIEKRAQSNRLPGTLLIREEKGVPRIYWRKDTKMTNGIYLSQSEIDTIKTLAQQDYDDKLTNAASETRRALKICTRILSKCPDPDEVYNKLPAIRKELVEKESISMTIIDKWKNREPYRKLGFLDGDKIIVARNGLRVRSKTEEIIVNIFEDLGIPYIFEYPIQVDGDRLYPDFLVLNVRTGKEYVYEHFGRLDDPDYVDRSFLRKLELYSKAGYTVGKNLVMTFESLNHPLNEQYLMKFIQDTFL